MINLFTSYYQTPNKERQKELDFCKESNENNPFIDRYFYWEERFTYNDFFEKTKEFPDDINILANGDIYFDDSIELLKGMSVRDAYALTRWEIEGSEVVHFETKHKYNKEAKAKHSQDVWVFRGAVNKVYGGFYLGVPGTDNRIAYEIIRGGYILTNPSLSIKAIHKHKEESRNYQTPKGSPSKIPPPYKWVEQTRLITRSAR